MTRATRRAAVERKKGQARHLLTKVWCYGPDFATPHRVGMYAATMKPCSCWGCGNARRHDGPTRRERQHQPDCP